MSSLPSIGFGGLKTSGNELSYRPGTLRAAVNTVIDSHDVLSPRRGQPIDYAHPFSGGTDYASTLVEYQTKLIAHKGPQGSNADALVMSTPQSSAWVALAGTWTEPNPDEQRMKFAELAKNLYWTSSTGLGVLDGVATGTARLAGVGRPGDFIGNLGITHLSGNPNATGSWLHQDVAVGYTAVVGRKDKNGNVKLSAPCARLVVVNPADVTSAVGGLSRTGATVTATVTAHNFSVGDIFALSPGEANFAAGNYTVTAITATTIVWTNAGAAVVSTAVQTLSSGVKSVSLIIGLPDGIGITAGDFVQVYRTLGSSGATSDPGAEFFLVYERTITAAAIASLFIVVVDTTPESFIGAALYSNANTGSAGGIAFTNERPPLCDDVALFDGRLWATNTLGPHQLTIRLLGTDSPNGLQSGDLLAIDTQVYTMSSSIVQTAYLPTRNVTETNAVLAWALNNLAGSSICAMSVPNVDTQATALLLQRKSVTSGVFYSGSSRASCWQDPMPTVTAVTEASSSRTSNVVTITTTTAHGLATGDSVVLAISNLAVEDVNFPVGVKTPITVTGASTFTYAETGSNATMTGTYFIYAATLASEQVSQPLRFSQQGQPEAWPLVNYPSGLPDGADVMRILALRNSLYVFLRRGAIYTVSGAYPYSVQKFDGTSTLLAPDSLVEHNGKLHCLTTQGICAISESGVQVLSLDIEDQLREAMLSSTSMASSFAVSYESDRQYILYIGDTTTSRQCNEAYVWQSNEGKFGGKWSFAGILGRSCGLVLKNAAAAAELLVTGTIGYQALRYERKTYTYTDYFEDSIVAGNGSNIQCNGGGLFLALSGTPFSGVEVGDAIYWNNDPAQAGHVTAVDASSMQLDTAVGSVSDTAQITILKGIYPLQLDWVAAAAPSPAVEKQWSEVTVHADSFEVDLVSAVFTTERTQNTPVLERTLTISNVGKYEFTDVDRALFTLRAAVHTQCQRAAMLRVGLDFGYRAGQHFRLFGYSLKTETGGDRTGYKSGVAP